MHAKDEDIFSKRNKFVDVIQKSRIGLTSYVLQGIKKRIDINFFENRSMFESINKTLPITMNSAIPFGSIKYNIRQYTDKEISFDLILVPGGSVCELYEMPNPSGMASFSSRSSSSVKMLDDLLMSASDITEELWLDVMRTYPKAYNKKRAAETFEQPSNLSNPITCMNMSEAKEFCNKLSELCGLQPCYTVIKKIDKNSESIGGAIIDYNTINIEANGFRLPTLIEYLHAAKTGYRTTDYLKYVLENCSALKTMKCVNMKSATSFSHYTFEPIPVEKIKDMFSDIIDGDTIKNEQGNSLEELFAYCFNGITPQELCSILEKIDPNDLSGSRDYRRDIIEDLNIREALRKMNFKTQVMNVVEKYECINSTKICPTKTKQPNKWGFYDASSNVRKMTQNAYNTEAIMMSTGGQIATYSTYLKKEYGTTIKAKSTYGSSDIFDIDLKESETRVLLGQETEPLPLVVFGETSAADFKTGYCMNMFLNSKIYGFKPSVGMMQIGIQQGTGFKIVKQIPKDPRTVGY